MKRAFGWSLVFMLVALMLMANACSSGSADEESVPKASYDTLRADLDALQVRQAETVQERNALQSTNSSLEAEKARLTGEVDSLKAGLDSIRADLDALKSQQSKLEQSRVSLQDSNSALATEKARLAAELASAGESYTALKARFDTITKELDSLKAKVETLKAEQTLAANAKKAAQAQIDSLTTSNESTKKALADMEARYSQLLQRTQTSSLKNPTWVELAAFVKADNTDTRPYVADEFDCEGFTLLLRDNAARQGFRSAYVGLAFGEGVVGHALNAFQTTDKGLVYIDNTQRDAVAYVEKGQIYGTIVTDGVKSEFIDCSASPGDFWRPLSNARFIGNLFSYDYYRNYSQRSRFYDDTVAAFNTEVAAYNAAVTAYNQGSGRYTTSEIRSWESKLGAWKANIDALISDLGGVRVDPLGVISSIEIYWN